MLIGLFSLIMGIFFSLAFISAIIIWLDRNLGQKIQFVSVKIRLKSIEQFSKKW